jgi:hypothetical protein
MMLVGRMACFSGGTWSAENSPEVIRGLEKGRRSPGTRLATISLAERRNGVSARYPRLER